MSTHAESTAADVPGRRLRDIFQRAPYLSLKHESYFQVYEDLLARYVGQAFTFVEVGVLNGGSLFMWREYFGPRARILGIDLNPEAVKWRDHGFEIVIGDQSDPGFWDAFYGAIGMVDVVLDDGGHTNAQQVVTAHKAIEHVRDGGLVLVEDVHASYLPEFGNPSSHSFVSFATRMVDAIQARFPAVKAVGNDYWKKVYSIAFYESIVAFHVDSRRCAMNAWASNGGQGSDARDFRHMSPVKTVLF